MDGKRFEFVGIRKEGRVEGYVELGDLTQLPQTAASPSITDWCSWESIGLMTRGASSLMLKLEYMISSLK